MLRRAYHLKKYKLRTTDGDIGKIKDFYFNDQDWIIRYLVADTGGWLSGRQVLLSPFAVHGIDQGDQVVKVDLSKRQIEEAPSLEADRPVSRQYEELYYRYYGWPQYWYGPEPWGPVTSPAAYAAAPAPAPVAPAQGEAWRNAGDPNLRSANEVAGYHVQARDQSIGHVDDFVLDGDEWVMRYLVVDTVNWWPGKKVLLPPQWVNSVSWHQNLIHVDLSRETIKQAPEFGESADITRAYEEELFRHYGREGYWGRAVGAAGHR